MLNATGAAMMQSIRNFIFFAIGVTLLSGCGGGGGGGGSAAPNDTGDGNLATITTQNAPAVAGVVATVALEDGIFGAIFNQNLPIASSGSPQILTGVSKVAQPSNLFATSSGLADCAVSGTVDVELTITDPFAPSVGDLFRFTFDACNDGTGTETSGSMTISITALQGDPASGEFLLGTSLEFSALQITENGETSSANGTINIEIDTTTPPITTITVSASALATTTEGAVETVTDLTVTISEDQSMFPTGVTVETSFRITSPRIGGDVIVSTSLALQSMGDEYPYVGELRITAADNAVIVLIAFDSNSVRLQIDVDGDGAMDETIDTTWDEIMAAAAAA